jgi:hypothetical protein
MTIQSLVKDCEFVYIEPEATAGTSTLTSDVVDLQGWDGCLFIALTGDATSGTVLTLAALGNTANSTSGAVAITGASASYTSTSATDADNKMLLVDVVRPLKRYAHVTLTRATQNCVCNGIIAIKYRGAKAPITQSASHVIASALAAAA